MENDVFSGLMRMVSALALVLGVMLLVYWLARKFLLKGQGAAAGGRVIQVLAHQALGPKRGVAVVRVAGEYLVLGLGGDRVSLLSRIEHPDSVEMLLGSANGGPKQSFAGVLGAVLNPLHREKRETQ